MRFFARRFSFFDWALDLPDAAAELLLLAGCGGGFRAALAVRQPESESARGVAALAASCCSCFPGRSKLQISHSHSEALFIKVHRRHSHSSAGRVSGTLGVDPPIRRSEGL